MMTGESVEHEASFASWYADVEPRLRAALVARYGPERGRDAAAAALAWAWEHWGESGDWESPVGLLYRVGQSKSRLRRQGWLSNDTRATPPDVEPALPEALARLPRQQRSVVVLVHGYDWTLAEVADLLGISKSSVQTHLERGMARVRQRLGVTA